MKVCSDCQRCYDDSVVSCSFDEHSELLDLRSGDCKLLDGFEIKSRIETSSMVELFRATHLASEKNVLVRIIKTNNSVAELRSELQSYANVNHSNLARIFEFGKLETGEVYVVFEDYEGQSLRSLLDRSVTLSEIQSIEIARQIAEGLEQLHTVELLHGNVNPANIFITRDEDEAIKAKLTNFDFGGIIENDVVKNANGINAKTSFFEYFSPEQFSAKEVDHKSDLYSLAIVFYEMLLGRTPYELLSPQAITEYVFNEDDVDGLNHDLRSLIAYTLRESLQQRLSLRPRSTDKLVRQLRHLELIAKPSEKILNEEDEIQTPPKWTSKITDREQVISKLKQSIKVPDKYDLETETEIIPKYEKVTISESENDLEEYYLADKPADIINQPATENFVLNDDNTEFIEQEEVEYLPMPAIATNLPSNDKYSDSITFRKSHVYIAGALATLLFGSLFLITFYNLQSNASSTKVDLTEKPTIEENTEKPETIQKVEDLKSLPDEIANEDKNSSTETVLTENVEQENIGNKTASISQNSTKSDLSAKKDKTKVVKKAKNKKTSINDGIAKKNPFEDTVIIIGDKPQNTRKKNKQSNENSRTKNSKVFSDVVITY